MDNQPEVIRQQMEETRTALTQKLESLEEKVVTTVQDATSAVTDTVDNVKDAVQETVSSVKDTVQDTVDSVRDTFDIERQVQRHPWVMVGGSLALGYVVGSLLNRNTAPREKYKPQPRLDSMATSNYRPFTNGSRAAASDQPAPETEAEGPSWFSTITDKFGPELDKLKGMAIGTALGLVRDLVTQSLPEQMKEQVADLVNTVTVKLGGEPVRGQVFDTSAFFVKEERPAACDRGPADLGRPMASVHR